MELDNTTLLAIRAAAHSVKSAADTFGVWSREAFQAVEGAAKEWGALAKRRASDAEQEVLDARAEEAALEYRAGEREEALRQQLAALKAKLADSAHELRNAAVPGAVRAKDERVKELFRRCSAVGDELAALLRSLEG